MEAALQSHPLGSPRKLTTIAPSTGASARQLTRSSHTSPVPATLSPANAGSRTRKLIPLAPLHRYENVQCLIDAIVTGDEDEARRTLQVQADLDASRPTPSVFSFEPSAVTVGVSTNVRVVLESSLASASSYNLYRVPSGGFIPAARSLLVLSSLSGKKFGATLAVRTRGAGEVQSFVAYPVVNGQERRRHAVWALDAVRSFTKQSVIGANGTRSTDMSTTTLPNNTTLQIRYSWPLDQPDLDTGTFFLGESVGYSCTQSTFLSRKYLKFSGDITSRGGSETVRVFLADAIVDGQWNDSTEITLKAGWYSSGIGAATVRVSLLDGKARTVGEELEAVINPPAGAPGAVNCTAAPSVGSVTVSLGSRVDIKLVSI